MSDVWVLHLKHVVTARASGGIPSMVNGVGFTGKVSFATTVANETIDPRRWKPDRLADASAKQCGSADQQRDERLVHVGQPALAVAVETSHREACDGLTEGDFELLDLDLDAPVRAVEEEPRRRRTPELLDAHVQR